MRSAYQNSEKPGQRAARILSRKITDFKVDEKNVWLDKADLAVVEKGQKGMQQITDLEQKLLDLSRRRKRIRVYALTAAFLVLVGFGYWAVTETTKQKELRRIAEAQYENTQWIIEGGYFDVRRNPQGKGIDNKFELQKNGLIVYDGATSLYWQQSGSLRMNYAKAREYIRHLNNQKFVGYDNWRLPTLKEAMSLMEPQDWYGDFYIDYVFDREQNPIWTANEVSVGMVWLVTFTDGYCGRGDVNREGCVRAVRCGQ